ncbi:hypothetical protein GSU68_17870 [Rathayibacter sp. VKM Ac-2759]|uniref:hypothetical protein n=1 Tax=Rathayibacter sp. VKM Ac-2759 TaxID=2609252 RepID=UPI001315C7C2|nr:hypothetical protein [Rathayibacter sp. VKM Ac-2759]QHC68254.1 hypothetical protein GSU68_17870 [Rathayibacter sp. VKM Ac-2759]
MTDRSPDSSTSSSFRTTPGEVQRRTLVQGAAWTIPVVAVATGAPFAAASGTPTLAFVNGPYAATACQPLGSVILEATTDGTTPAVNETVMVTPPAGFTWSDDGTSAPRPFQTDATGQVTVTGLTAGPSNGSYALSASTSSASDSASVVVTGATSKIYQAALGGGTALPATLPAGVTVKDIQSAYDPTTGFVFVAVLGSDGKVYRTNSSVGYSSYNVVSPAGTTAFTISSDQGTFTTDGTTVYQAGLGGGTALPATLPAGVTATDIQSAVDPSTGFVFVAVLGSDGKVYRTNSSVGYSSYNVVSPAGTTAFTISSDQGTFTTDGTTVYQAGLGGGTALPATLPAGVTATDIQSAVDPSTGFVFVAVLGSDGKVYRTNSSTGYSSYNVVSPAGTTAFTVSSDQGTFTTDGTTVYQAGLGGGTALPATLPAGVTVKDIQSAYDPTTGFVFVAVLGSDGKVYRTNSSTGYSQFNVVSPAGTTAFTISSDAGTFAAVEAC